MRNKHKTTIEIQAEPVAKLRAMLRALGSRKTAENVIAEYVQSLVSQEPAQGFLGDWIHGFDGWQNHPDKSAIEAKMRRINAGDRRLIRPEPLARNVTVYDWVLGPLDKMVSEAENGSRNSAVNYLLARALGVPMMTVEPEPDKELAEA